MAEPAERELGEVETMAEFRGALLQDANRTRTISGPMPSPGRRTIFFETGLDMVVFAAHKRIPARRGPTV